MRSVSIMLLFSAFGTRAAAQAGDLPIKEWGTADQTPFILYISGDGGFNKFSTDLCTALSRTGYHITAMNAKSYFWGKKTPEQTTADISAYLERALANQPNRKLVLLGYSFGADVMPFIVNRLKKTIKNRLSSVVLISPSTSTDFQIHWSDMFGGNTKRNMDVVAEINRLTVPKLSTFFGVEEKDFPVTSIHLPNYSNQVLPGGHHFDGVTGELAKMVVNELK